MNRCAICHQPSLASWCNSCADIACRKIEPDFAKTWEKAKTAYTSSTARDHIDAMRYSYEQIMRDIDKKIEEDLYSTTAHQTVTTTMCDRCGKRCVTPPHGMGHFICCGTAVVKGAA